MPGSRWPPHGPEHARFFEAGAEDFRQPLHLDIQICRTAVNTIVSQQRNATRAAWIGVFWGLGHSVTILFVGSVIILFNLVIPARLGLAMELSVGLMLILLGGWNLVSFVRSVPVPEMQGGRDHAIVHSHPHRHGDYIHSHPHGHEPETYPHSPERSTLVRLRSVYLLHFRQGLTAIWTQSQS